MKSLETLAFELQTLALEKNNPDERNHEEADQCMVEIAIQLITQALPSDKLIFELLLAVRAYSHMDRWYA